MHRRWRRLVLGPLVALGAATLAPALPATAAPVWQPGTPPLVTPWTDDVSPSNALPEYPRPQLTRDAWQNLNGVWEFAAATAGEPAPVGRTLPERILVPYPVESALSGIQRHEDAMWYRRIADVPASWRSQRVMLNFGAVDYRATVWVNGVRVGAHAGGYDSWSLDVTPALVSGGPQEVLVRVEDPTDAGEQPVGKQRNDAGGIFYTPSSGIWQTVWMESVAPSHVERLDLTPNLRNSTVRVAVRTTAAAPDQRVRVSAYDGSRKVGEVLGAPNTNLALPVPNPRLWSPADPFLYDLRVTLLGGGGRALDSVGSYVGMRSIAVARGPDGKPRTVLNGRFLFGMGTLDQGFWPDGIYTAPTDEALRFDLEQQKRLGFNTVRKHIKVEPARWYYWTDKLGLMVWQDMPSTKIDWPENGGQPTTTARANFERELRRIVTQLRSVTSIVTWVPFNEGWGDYEVGRIAGLVKTLDPSRIVDAESGVNCCASEPDSGAGDLYDDHTYVGPGTPQPFDDRAVVDGEYGGLGLRVPGHEWSPGNGFAYETEPDAATLTRRYLELSARVRLAEERCGLSAAIYTQPTDVENEINGLWTYDRQVLKPDAEQIAAANRAVIDASGSVGTAPPLLPPGTPGLTGVGYWPLDEGSGTVAQDVAGDHDATLVGGPQWTAGQAGSALRFDGSTQYADTGASILDTEGSFSVSAWVRLDSAGGAFATAVSQDGDRASAFFLQYSGADGRFAFSTVSGRALAPAPPEVGRWYHLVGVRDAAAGQLRLYVDGQLAGTKAQCLTDPGPGHTVIGRGQYNGQQVDFWRGAVDEVHVYDRALTDAEVAQLTTSA